MKWVEVKMRELGVTTHPDYKVSFMLDHRAMITVQTERYGELLPFLLMMTAATHRSRGCNTTCLFQK